MMSNKFNTVYSMDKSTFSDSLPPHLCHNSNADKRSAYRVGEQDAWASEPTHHAGLCKDCTRQTCRGYDKPLNPTSTHSNVNHCILLWSDS